MAPKVMALITTCRYLHCWHFDWNEPRLACQLLLSFQNFEKIKSDHILPLLQIWQRFPIHWIEAQIFIMACVAQCGLPPIITMQSTLNLALAPFALSCYWTLHTQGYHQAFTVILSSAWSPSLQSFVQITSSQWSLPCPPYFELNFAMLS